jgi:hypothetical protein
MIHCRIVVGYCGVVDSVVPVEKILFSFYSISMVRLIYAATVARKGWVHLSVEQTGRPDQLSLT